VRWQVDKGQKNMADQQAAPAIRTLDGACAELGSDYLASGKRGRMELRN
jgi:hypothetical protein